MRPTLSLTAASLLAALLLSSPAQAGEGHDHGDAAPAPTGAALPRFAAVSDTFELVGVLSGKQITLYLDQAADNTPVSGAQIELDIAGTKLKAQKHEAQEDAYEVVLPAEPTPGVLPIVATVTAGLPSITGTHTAVDLLAAELDVHEEAHADEAAPVHRWKGIAIGSAVAAVLIALAFIARQRRAGGAA